MPFVLYYSHGVKLVLMSESDKYGQKRQGAKTGERKGGECHWCEWKNLL